MLSSHLAYCRYSVLLLRCSIMDLVMVLEVIIFLNYYNRSELYQNKKKNPEFSDSLALYCWFHSYCYHFRLI